MKISLSCAHDGTHLSIKRGGKDEALIDKIAELSNPNKQNSTVWHGYKGLEMQSNPLQGRPRLNMWGSTFPYLKSKSSGYDSGGWHEVANPKSTSQKPFDFNVSPLRALLFANEVSMKFPVLTPRFVAVQFLEEGFLPAISQLLAKDVEWVINDDDAASGPFDTVIGIELEGGWTASEWGKLPDSMRDGSGLGKKHDGSVTVSGSAAVGEVASEIFLARNASTWKKWIKDVYPSKTNKTCGMHVHVGYFAGSNKIKALRTRMLPVESAPYLAIMDKDNHDKIMDFFKKNCRSHGYSALLPRIKGEDTSYCKDLYAPIGQLVGDVSRQTAVNWNAFAGHRSVEFRMFPMGATADIACTIIKDLLAILDEVTNNCTNFKCTLEVF